VGLPVQIPISTHAKDCLSKNTPANNPVLTVRVPATNDKGCLLNQEIVRQGGMYSIQYFSLYLIAILYIISIKVKTNDFHEFSALSRLETAVELKPRLVCDQLGTEPAEYGNSCGCHNRLAVSRVVATLVLYIS
jgi:hypothetical protein